MIAGARPTPTQPPALTSRGPGLAEPQSAASTAPIAEKAKTHWNVSRKARNAPSLGARGSRGMMGSTPVGKNERSPVNIASIAPPIKIAGKIGKNCIR